MNTILKKILMTAMALSLTLTPVVSTAASTTNTTDKLIKFQIGSYMYTVNSESKWIESGNKNAKPVIVKSRTLLPIRPLVEEMGGEVTWIAASRTVVIGIDNHLIVLEVGSKYAEDQITKERFELEVPVTIIGGKTLVPLRFVAEYIGLDVEWFGTSNTAVISNGPVIGNDPVISNDPVVPKETTTLPPIKYDADGTVSTIIYPTPMNLVVGEGKLSDLGSDLFKGYFLPISDKYYLIDSAAGKEYYNLVYTVKTATEDTKINSKGVAFMKLIKDGSFKSMGSYSNDDGSVRNYINGNDFDFDYIMIYDGTRNGAVVIMENPFK